MRLRVRVRVRGLGLGLGLGMGLGSGVVFEVKNGYQGSCRVLIRARNRLSMVRSRESNDIGSKTRSAIIHENVGTPKIR